MPKREIPSPDEFFGFKMGADGKLARWDKIVEYFQMLDKKSPRLKVVELGKSTMGNPFILAVITSPKNLENLDKIREMSWRIAHPRGLSEEEVEDIIRNGKAVVAMTMSIHATEVGGTQMTPELAYDLVTSENPTFQKIRENTVLLLFPCFNPDGQIMVTEWYNKWLGTEYEGGRIPWLYHKYTGHDNNRDAFTLTQVESRMVSRVLYNEWFPQAYIDFHHMGSYGARFSIPPHTDPLYEHVDPLVWTEQQLYGGAMLVELEAAGKTGIETQATYPADGGPYWDESPIAHNICGMLTESASAKLATPIYIHYQQLEPARRGRPEYRVMTTFPHPWPGGWWRLRDVVEQQKIAALAVLKCATNFRVRILRNMYLKATRQIEAGESQPPYAFIVSPEQHDMLTAVKLLRNLQAADVEVHRAKEEFKAEGVTYPKGTYVIFTSQTCRPYILKLLKRTFYHDGPLTRRPDGTPLGPYDLSTDTLHEFMGAKVVEASKPLKGSFEVYDSIQFPRGGVEESEYGYLIDGRLNESFAVVYSLLKKGVEVYRVLEAVGDLPVGTFYIPEQEGLEKELAGYADRHYIIFYAVESDEFEKRPIKTLRIAVYQRYRGGNIDEGWTRWLLEEYGFEYTTIRDAEIKEGKLADKYDVIILPSDDRNIILGEKLEEYYQKRRPKSVPPKYPPEYESGIKKEGVEKVKEFVEAGGTLIFLGRASEFAIEDLKLPIINVVKDVKSKDFFCPGSTLKVKVDTTHPLAYGVADDCLILFRGFPVFEIKKGANNEDYRVVVSYPEERILQSGWLIGEKYLSRKAALVDAKLGKGRVILFGFSPQFRAITDATFKFFFNSLLG